MIPDRLRLSIGSAAVLGLLNYKLSVPPTTAYLMSYTDSRCLANCSFCAQACGNTADQDKLSRVIWPDFPLDEIISGLKNPANSTLKRVCYQAINYPGFLEDSIDIIKLLKQETQLPISIDICPVSRSGLKKIHEAGAEYISLPLDGATEEVFNRIKGKDVNGPYRWETHLLALKNAVEIFGEENVCSNIIVGLGETEADVVRLIQKLHNLGVMPILFAFTPIPGTRLENLAQPDLSSYRRIQVARHLIVYGFATIENISLKHGNIVGFTLPDLEKRLSDGEAFQTTGCPGCNRPFYNERPSGPFYNYPRNLSRAEVEKELKSLKINF
jgi:biotin synthase-related radical SAM superfamily protein